MALRGYLCNRKRENEFGHSFSRFFCRYFVKNVSDIIFTKSHGVENTSDLVCFFFDVDESYPFPDGSMFNNL